MYSYEDYMKAHPSVSRNRAERLITEGPCFFLKVNRFDVALLPGNSSTDDLVMVGLKDEDCQCNVYRMKKACPHVAAALGIVEKHRGKIPYTEPVPHVYSCLDALKKAQNSISRYNSRYNVNLFLRNVNPFLNLLPKAEKAKCLLELGLYLETKDTLLTDNDFLNCYHRTIQGDREYSSIGKLLYENRQKCMKAVAALITQYFSCPFSNAEKKVILREIAASSTLVRNHMSSLIDEYYEYFTREQLVDYYSSVKEEQISPFILGKCMNRLLTEEPPMYADFLKIYNRLPSASSHVDLDPSLIDTLIDAGYEDQLEKLVNNMVCRIKCMDDYKRIIQVLSHEKFLAAWKARKNNKKRFDWHGAPKEWEIEIEFLENPEADPDQYCLENLSCHLLNVILQARPECQDEINQIARKKYRQAEKIGKRKEMANALMVLVRGQDAIAMKYASKWKENAKDEDLVYLVATGMNFNCLNTLIPEIQEMEVPYAAGQD